jgi:hypothetical protein
MTSTHRAENIFPKYLLYYVHEIALKYPREKNRYSSFSDSVGGVPAGSSLPVRAPAGPPLLAGRPAGPPLLAGRPAGSPLLARGPARFSFQVGGQTGSPLVAGG